MQLKSLVCGSLVVLGACSGDDAKTPTPTEVRAAIDSDLTHVVREAKAAFDGTSKSLPAMPGSVDVATAMVKLRYPKLAAALTPATHLRARPDTGSGSGSGSGDDFDPEAAANWLNENLFTDANEVEPGIYTVPASVVCQTETVDSSGNTTESIDPDCAAKLAAADVRVRVSETGSTLAFWLQVDAHHDEPLGFTLTADSVGATVNLDGASAAMAALAPVFGETAPNASLAGAVSGTLTVAGAAQASLKVAIDRDLAIAFADDGVALDGDAAVRFASAKSTVVDLALDGNTQAGTLAAALGATTAHLPADADAGEPSLDLDLPGASANVAVVAGGPVQVSNVSLGDRTTTVKSGGALAASIDVNPDDGRAFGATIAGDDTGATIQLAPKVDLRLFQDHAVLNDGQPDFDVTQLLATGTLATSAASEQVKVVSGGFTVVTNPASFGVSIGAGQCAAQDVDTGAWVAQTCEL